MPQPVPAAPPLFIVLNPRSGGDEPGAGRPLIERVLNEAGRAFTVFELSPGVPVATVAERAAQAAKREGGAVVAAGGDGTINAVAQAALAAGCPMGVIPKGTFNYFGRAHGIPQDTEAATRALLVAAVQPVQVGRVRGRQRAFVFLVNASLGLYPKLLEDREAYKREYGRSRLVAAWAALATVSTAHRPLRLELESGGQTRRVRTQTLFVGNNPLQLEQTGIDDVATIEPGALVAVMLAPVGTLQMLKLLLRGAFGQLGQDDKVHSFGFTRLAVQPAAPLGRRRVKVATDGEVFYLRAPLVFDVWPEPLQLLKPAPAAGDRGR